MRSGPAMTEASLQASGQRGRLLIFGLGYSGAAVAVAARAAGFRVSGTTRAGTDGSIPFDAAAAAVQSATHLLTTAGPDEAGCGPGWRACATRGRRQTSGAA